MLGNPNLMDQMQMQMQDPADQQYYVSGEQTAVPNASVVSRSRATDRATRSSTGRRASKRATTTSTTAFTTSRR